MVLYFNEYFKCLVHVLLPYINLLIEIVQWSLNTNAHNEFKIYVIFFFLFKALIEKSLSGDSKEGPSLQLLKEALINTRQHEAFLRVILVCMQVN